MKGLLLFNHRSAGRVVPGLPMMQNNLATRTCRLLPGLCSHSFRFQHLRFSRSRSFLHRRPCTSHASANQVTEAGSTRTQEAGRSEQGNGAQKAPTFQEAISRLQEYWASVGCAVWLPHNSEVGAGTMNPATFLRVLGPEPWKVCYAEPSVRPDDSRYGDNPNRVQRHTQFQVILKPDPGNPQELYLESLAALGINSQAHDIRFVEDNWESPVLGAWGLGWEVWMDGMEVTQFTYFQQAGGQPLSVPAVEITYGLERILMALQGVNHFKNIMYSQHITYGELFLQNEFELSKYNLEEAVVEDHWQRFELYETEAKHMLEKGLPVPAYENLLKCSHAFNILDARGAVGVTERNNSFAAMRMLARNVAKLWIARREELGHPLGIVKPSKKLGVQDEPIAKSSEEPRLFVLEIGCEELPPQEVTSSMGQLESIIDDVLVKSRLQHGGVKALGTPRRLVVLVKELSGHQDILEEKIRGPPSKIAYTEDGEPTKALLGFCQKNGVLPENAIKESDSKGVEYIYAVVRDEGKSSTEVLLEYLPAALSSVSFQKSMKWNSGLTWSRPIRWILALHGNAEVPFTLGDTRAGASTRMLRGDSPDALSFASAEDYLSTMERSKITLGLGERRKMILTDVEAAAQQEGGLVPEPFLSDLVEEVANLVESPTIITGSFAEEFIHLPIEVLSTVMRKHQRYFPVVSKDDPEALLPKFITVANGRIDRDVVQSGNEAVLQARFQDAEFFYKEDLEQPLDAMREKLSGTMFEKSLGNLLEKSVRIEKLARPIGYETGLQHTEVVAKRSARICRADLASSVVTEITSLAGIMGRHYALFWGESPDVAQAIFESVLPRFSGDSLPATSAGIVLSLADKIDSLVGLVAAGRTPSGASDPFAMRRSAYGLLQTLIHNKVHFDIPEAVELAAGLQKIEVKPKAHKEVLVFIQRRLEQLLVDSGIPITAVRSVLSERGHDPYLASTSAEELAKQLDAGEESLLSTVLTPMARPIRIVRSKNIDERAPVDESLFENDEERSLWQAYIEAKEKVTKSMPIFSFLEVCKEMRDPIDQYFDNVFVMSENEAVRSNRLNTLKRVADLPKGILDFSELPGF